MLRRSCGFAIEVRRLAPDDPKVAELRVRAEKELELGVVRCGAGNLARGGKAGCRRRAMPCATITAPAPCPRRRPRPWPPAARADLRYDLAMGDLGRALALYAELEGPDLARADRVAYTDLYWDQGDLFRLVGNSRLALRSYQAWEAVAAARVAEAPEDGDWSAQPGGGGDQHRRHAVCARRSGWRRGQLIRRRCRWMRMLAARPGCAVEMAA